jgi:hypothetical protein
MLKASVLPRSFVLVFHSVVGVIGLDLFVCLGFREGCVAKAQFPIILDAGNLVSENHHSETVRKVVRVVPEALFW